MNDVISENAGTANVQELLHLVKKAKYVYTYSHLGENIEQAYVRAVKSGLLSTLATIHYECEFTFVACERNGKLESLYIN